MTHFARLQDPTASPLSMGLIKRHPVPTFYVLAFAISWAGILFLVGGPGGIPGTAEQVERLFLPFMAVWLAGPSLASVITTALVDGRAGLRELLARLLRWRVAARWFAVALLTGSTRGCGDIVCALAGLPGVPPQHPEDERQDWPVLVMALAYGLIGGGFLEELGWTGFAVPRLRPRFGLLGTGLIVGMLWGAYHFSVIFWSTGPSGALPLVVLLVQLFAWLPAFRVLMVWVYDHTGSLLGGDADARESYG